MASGGDNTPTVLLFILNDIIVILHTKKKEKKRLQVIRQSIISAIQMLVSLVAPHRL